MGRCVHLSTDDTTGDTLTMERGVNFSAVIEPYEDDEETQRTDLAPDDWLVVFRAREQRDSASTLIAVDSDDTDARLVVEAVDDGHIIRLRLNGDQTAAVTRSGVWEIVRVDRNDEANIDPIGTGPLVVTGRMIEDLDENTP